MSDPFDDSECLANITIHENFEMRDFRLLLCSKHPWLCVSPDGETYCSSNILCMSWDWLKQQNIFWVFDEEYILAKNHKYYSQVQR